jgi:WD40 repeat protein
MNRLWVIVIALGLLSAACSTGTISQPATVAPATATTAPPTRTAAPSPTSPPTSTPTAVLSPTPEPDVRISPDTLSQLRLRWFVREPGKSLGFASLQCEDKCDVATRIGGYAFSPDGAQLAIGVCSQDMTDNRTDRKHPRYACSAGEVRRYAVADGELLGSEPVEGYPLSIAWGPVGDVLAAGMADGQIDVWHLAASDSPQQVRHPSTFFGVTSLLFSVDGTQLFSQGDGKIVAWDWAAGTDLKTMEGDGKMALSPSGQQLITGWYSSATARTTIRIFDLTQLGRSKDIRPRFVQPSMGDRNILTAFVEDESQILIVGSNGAEWWNAQSLQLQGHTDVMPLISDKTTAFSPVGAITPDGLVLTEPGIGIAIPGFTLPLLTAGPSTCGFALWNPTAAGALAVPTGAGICETAIASGDSHRVVISPDDRFLAADDGSGDLRVWAVDPTAAAVAPICLGDCQGG